MKHPILSEAELTRLASVIGEMEDSTAGEIRLVIVKRSAAVGHVSFLIWSLLMVASFLAVWSFREALLPWEQWWLWPAITVVALILARVLSETSALQRLLTASHDLSSQVWARAEVEFSREVQGRTRSKTGILLFLSRMERQAVVLAESGIATKLPAGSWDAVVAKIVSGSSTRRWAEKLEEAIRMCGAQLAAHYPQEPGDTNEIPNTVIVKD